MVTNLIKVSGVWRMIAMVLIGMVLGILLSYTILNKATQGEGQSISIGKLKIKNSSDIENVINIDQDKKETKEKRGLFRSR